MNSKIEALRARKQDGGFTLVELLIVIVVLGILAGITAFGVASFRANAVTAACNANVKTIETAADAYRAQSPTTAYPADVTTLVTGGYLKSAPTNGVYAISSTGVVTVTSCTG